MKIIIRFVKFMIYGLEFIYNILIIDIKNNYLYLNIIELYIILFVVRHIFYYTYVYN